MTDNDGKTTFIFIGGQDRISCSNPKLVGLLARLTPEQRKKALSYKGDDTIGEPIK